MATSTFILIHPIGPRQRRWSDTIRDQRPPTTPDGRHRARAPQARVVRDGVEQMPAAAVVPGDLLILAGGDLVAADGEVTESAALLVDESSLTGPCLQPTPPTWRRCCAPRCFARTTSTVRRSHSPVIQPERLVPEVKDKRL